MMLLSVDFEEQRRHPRSQHTVSSPCPHLNEVHQMKLEQYVDEKGL